MEIGFLKIRLIDIIDILLVAFILYQIYKLLRGSLAFNIFIGLLVFYAVTQITNLLGMTLVNGILSQFLNVGVLALLIVFQPEVRRFLLQLGRGNPFNSINFSKITNWRKKNDKIKADPQIKEALVGAINKFTEDRTGALIVLADSREKTFFDDTGILLDANISIKLLQSIFDKTSPLHDGAAIVSGNKITRAGCILPVSENSDIPSTVGLRHRAAVGITEQIDVKVITVSEETGKVSYAKEGKLTYQLQRKALSSILDVVLVDKAK